MTLSHANPITGETVRTYHTIEDKTQRQAERRRDARNDERSAYGRAADGRAIQADTIAAPWQRLRRTLGIH